MTTIHSKEHFLASIQESFEQIFTIIERVPTRKRKLTVEIEARDKNFRDVLMHLYEWHAMLERWYNEGMSGDTPSMPAPGYQWRTLHKLNHQIWLNYQDVTLTQAMKRVKLSHQRVVNLIELHTYDEIMTKKCTSGQKQVTCIVILQPTQWIITTGQSKNARRLKRR